MGAFYARIAFMPCDGLGETSGDRLGDLLVRVFLIVN